MKKFSNIKTAEQESIIKTKKEEVVFKNDHLKVIKYDTQSVVEFKDCVICIPYLIEENKFIIRQEYTPAFKLSEGQDMHLACVGGGIESGETPEEALLRELQEEAGIVLRDSYKIEFDKPLFLNKGTNTKCHMAILTLNDSDYHEVVIRGDGSKVEKMSQTAKIDVKYVHSLNPSDIITDYMLMKFKTFLGI